MRFTIWGARGSHPKPTTPQQMRSKISAVVQRIQQKDILSPATREAFLSGLPEWLFGCYSGNTACVSVDTQSGNTFLFDAGTGIVEYWQTQLKSGSPVSGRNYHLFFTHFHYDHVQGFPFFVPAYIPGNTIDIYSPQTELEANLKAHMRQPFFPVTIDGKMHADIRFHQLHPRGEIQMGADTILWRPIEHPGGAFGYLIQADGKRLMYCTDMNVTEEFYKKNQENRVFFENIDAIILDSQYTLGEALQKYDWGHTSYVHAVDFALHWGVRRLVMFHHEPGYDDQRLYINQKSARDYARSVGGDTLNIHLAREGDVIEV